MDRTENHGGPSAHHPRLSCSGTVATRRRTQRSTISQLCTVCVTCVLVTRPATPLTTIVDVRQSRNFGHFLRVRGQNRLIFKADLNLQRVFVLLANLSRNSRNRAPHPLTALVNQWQ